MDIFGYFVFFFRSTQIINIIYKMRFSKLSKHKKGTATKKSALSTD